MFLSILFHFTKKNKWEAHLNEYMEMHLFMLLEDMVELWNLLQLQKRLRKTALGAMLFFSMKKKEGIKD